ncbi:MAG: hypothetical protein E6Q78_16935 [Rhodoferax sp.]|nr:MAG: hypothetical protein E6Q78_16935 [Rhodoferax sp.]
MNRFLKLNLLGLYVLALVSLLMPMPWDSNALLQRLSLILLGVHVLETIVMFKHVKAYQGPLWKSVCLSLLFGLLHWLPLARKNRPTP